MKSSQKKSTHDNFLEFVEENRSKLIEVNLHFRYPKFYFRDFELLDFNKSIDDRIAICPLCGYVNSTVRLHINSEHKLKVADIRKQFKNYNSFCRNTSNILSNRMTENNPMKKLEAKQKVSKTRKRMYKEDAEFANKMRDIAINRSIRINWEDKMKIPGCGISGRFKKKIYFRSLNELKFLIHIDRLGKLDKLEINIRIKDEEFGNYVCDFKIEDEYYEIKDKTYAQDARERKQYNIIENMRKSGLKVFIWNKTTPELKDIGHLDMLDYFLKDEFEFSSNSQNKSIVIKLTKEKEEYRRGKI